VNTGEVSFRDLFGDCKRVEIPVIQRDYAQGREDDHSREVRKRFIEALGETLSADRPSSGPLDLDFVYGRWDGATRTLEPLDGQQRLTTLFLLHWYLASLDGAFDVFQSWATLPGGGSCFTYRTRPAAREFFDALVRQPAPLSTLGAEGRRVSEWAADSTWFVRNWNRDPTVRGCLMMLDAIHDRFATEIGAWSRLVSSESPAIVFRLLPLEHFNLSDDLYVKMNARGKPLTAFEVFKAELERFVGNAFGDELCPKASKMSWRDYVSRQFDMAWTDFLWKQRGGTIEIDARFMHLIRALAVVRCVDQSDDGDLADQLERLLETPEPSLQVYEELGCLDQAFIVGLVEGLDTLSGHAEAPSFLGRVDYLDEVDLLRRILLARGANQEDGLTLVDWVLFYAWCLFLRRYPQDLKSEQARACLHDWIRVVANLADNSDIDRHERLIAALRSVRQLSLNCGAGFLSCVADGALDKAGGFNQQQQREERLKAQLMLRSVDWRRHIERAETHPYFCGNIEFLLRFSGVVERAAPNGRCDWSDEEDVAVRQSFADYYERACTIFPENARAWPAQLPGFVWERALLATDNYLLQRGRNVSLLDERGDTSWKRLLRADKGCAVVGRVLAQIDPKDVFGSLEAIIAAGVQGDDSKPPPGIRRRLVAEPRLIEYCDRRMLRFEDDSAFLLSRTQRNGYHVDLYVYDLYFRVKARLAELAPFDGVECLQATGTNPPSRVRLRTLVPGPSLTVEKRGVKMRLQLQLPQRNPQLAALLAVWTVDEFGFHLAVAPDDAEAGILDLAAHLRALSIKPTAEG